MTVTEKQLVNYPSKYQDENKIRFPIPKHSTIRPALKFPYTANKLNLATFCYFIS